MTTEVGQVPQDLVVLEERFSFKPPMIDVVGQVWPVMLLQLLTMARVIFAAAELTLR